MRGFLNFNLPSVLQFGYGHMAEYLYDGAGVKRQVIKTTVNQNLSVAGGSFKEPTAAQKASVKTTDYVGNIIYENGTLTMILTGEGYITLSGTTPTYHYYLKDHQGNNRVVVNQSGTVTQVNHYYPFGGVFGGEGVDTAKQPFKYNDKEFDRTNGLDLYDYSARFMDAALGRFTTVDPLAEKYYGISPYVYCANNPVRYVDPTGRDLWDFLAGIGQSVKSNLSFGLAAASSEGISNVSHYNAGRNVGDVVSMAMGVVEMISGTTTAVGGSAATVATAGAASPLSVPTTAAGAATAVHGSGVITTAIKSLGKQEGRVSNANSNRKTNNPETSQNKSNTGTTETVITRNRKGTDGATSKHIIEIDSKGNKISKTHQVTNNNGETIHQHQDFIPQNLPKGEKAKMRQFPNEWVKYPKIDK